MVGNATSDHSVHWSANENDSGNILHTHSTTQPDDDDDDDNDEDDDDDTTTQTHACTHNLTEEFGILSNPLLLYFFTLRLCHSHQIGHKVVAQIDN